MKNSFVPFFYIFLCLVSKEAFSQVRYEQGYFIDRNNQRTECLIKNSEWKNNPVDFMYKLAEDDEPRKLDVSSVKEFGIAFSARYLAADVKIDRTGSFPDDLTTERNPVWLEERLFLKVLVEGSTSLLFYGAGQFQRYFYQQDDTVKQLVYKKYLNENNDVKESFAFRQQLWVDLKCGSVTESDIKDLRYNRSDLVRYFKDYLQCSGGEVVDYTKSTSKGKFHLKVTPGLNNSMLKALFSDNTQYKNDDVDYGSSADFRIGLEAEFVLPFQNDKWSIFVEPSYKTMSATSADGTKTAKLNSFEIPLGVRYNIFLGQNSSIFINGLYVFSLHGSSSYIQVVDFTPPVSTVGGFAAGAGFRLRRFSGEVRFYRNSDLLNDRVYWTAELNRLSVILGYRLF